ncbi:MAG: NTP transferase domain-containing protein, partial [Sphingomonadales bacterium]|nr:NTP transferase domain-containing protein [Sphingomonadales bacterium]
GLDRKAMVPIAGEPMLARMIAILSRHTAIGRIVVAAQDSPALAAEPALAAWRDDATIAFVEARDSIAATLSALLEDGTLGEALITTADNVLLTHAMIDHFLSASDGRDLAVAMVERDVALRAYPNTRRSWLRFRGGAWSGANLFRIGGAQVLPLIAVWRRVEQDRKKGWRVISAFGPGLLVAAALRLITLPAAIARVGRRYGLDATLVAMPQAEACIDVDKPDDARLAEAILARRDPAR